MQPILYKKILKYIKERHVRTLTVDVFDTILLNDYWPEDLRYYDLAKRWVNDLYQVSIPNLTAYELLDLRKQAEQELRVAGRAVQIDLLLDVMIDLICAKYDVELTDDERLQMLATMIADELQFRINNVCPNHNLIAQFKTLKQAYPELKIYFVTDTPFYFEQIKTMLAILDIDIFDGGVASSDYGDEKRTGKLYERLAAEFKDFDLAHNLHIGDCRWSDYLMPIAHDSYAIHYRPVRMRGLRTLVGRSAMGVIRRSVQYREQKNSSMLRQGGEDWQQCGMILGQYDMLWAQEINIQAELNDRCTYILTDGLRDLKTEMFTQDNIITSDLNKYNMLRAFVWLLATFETSRWNAGKLLELVANAASVKNRAELYRICFGEDYVYSELALESYDAAEFYQVFLAEVKSADKTISDNLSQRYETILQLISQAGKLCVVEMRDDSTVRLLSEFAKLHGAKIEIKEWILDTDGSVSKLKELVANDINDRRLRYFMRGQQDGNALLRQTKLAPAAYMQKILKPQLKRVVKAL